MDRKSVIILVLAILLGAILAGGGVYLWQSSKDDADSEAALDDAEDSDAAVDEDADAIPLGEAVDEGDVEETMISDEDAIRQAMADKYSKDVSEVELVVGDNNGEYARGSVSFAGEMGGGWWLAAKTGGTWEIVDDGNGVILCSVIEPYDFPASMVQECYDDTTGTVVIR